MSVIFSIRTTSATCVSHMMNLESLLRTVPPRACTHRACSRSATATMTSPMPSSQKSLPPFISKVSHPLSKEPIFAISKFLNLSQSFDRLVDEKEPLHDQSFNSCPSCLRSCTSLPTDRATRTASCGATMARSSGYLVDTTMSSTYSTLHMENS